MKAPPDQRALLELLEAYPIKDARRAVAARGRDVYELTPLGATEGNFGLVNIGSDPGFAFVERITNALDAVIDEAARHAPAALSSSWTRRAVRHSGRSVVHCSAEAQAELGGAVTVRIGDVSSVARPLLDVRDRGTGIAPDVMRQTVSRRRLRSGRFDHLRLLARRHGHRLGYREYSQSASPPCAFANSTRARMKTGATSI